MKDVPAEVFAGRYELLEQIGEGGMGTVWRARDRRLDIEVAAKVLGQHDADSLLRFVREQGLRVDHPHVLAPTGWAAEDDMVLLTMPLVRGGSLATLVQDHGALPAPFAVEVLRQVLLGLAEVHGRGIVHRDVKPANILLEATGAGRPHAYLGDFGIAVEDAGPRLTATGGFLGTPGFMAPEQALGGEPHATADLYAVGKVAQLVLTGERPRAAAPGAPHPGVPESLWAWVCQMTDPEPAARPQSVDEALGALDASGVSWVEGGAGDVVVLAQVGPWTGLDQPDPQDQATTPRLGGEEPATEARGDAGETQQQGMRWELPAAGLLALVSLAACIGGLLAWSPWGDGTAPAPTSSSVISSEPATTPTSGDSLPSSTSTTPTTTPRRTNASSTTGGVRVGTVVTRVGQRCGASELGERDATVGGVPVRCERDASGDPVWAEDD